MNTFFYILPALLLLSSCGHFTKETSSSAMTPSTQKRKMAGLYEERQTANLTLEKLKTKNGFAIQLFAIVPGARSMALHTDGTLFVGTGGFSNPYDRVYRLRDKNSDHQISDDEIQILVEGLSNPNGIALHQDDLYVAEMNQILVFKNISSVPWNSALRPDQFEKLPITLPDEAYHGWKYLRFGTKENADWLYYPVGAPCNVCLPSGAFTQIFRYNINTQEIQVVAKGQRNSVGFDFHPQTGNFWFTDNGRDLAGENFPPDELNEVTQVGEHFGFPFCHGKNYPDHRQYDPEFNKDKKINCEKLTQPRLELNPHGAALGMRFYNKKMFPPNLNGQVLISEHGSWNRNKKSGYQVGLGQLKTSPEKSTYEPLVWGWLDPNSNEAWGRPVDIEINQDGTVFISDDGFRDSKNPGAIYRLIYTGRQAAPMGK